MQVEQMGGVIFLTSSHSGTMPLPKDIAVQMAKDILKQAGYIQVYWNEKDIVKQASDMGLVLNETQIGDINWKIQETFDASIGVNWDTIETAINEILN